MSLIVAFPKIEDAKRIRDLLTRHGFTVDVVCATASAALSAMNRLDAGIIICGYKLPDMFFAELRDCMPRNYEMLLIASKRVLGTMDEKGVVSISMPVSAYELVNTLEMMLQGQRRRRRRLNEKPKPRPKEQQDIIDRAKALLMERNHMTESEAHRYIQKSSMDSGNSLVETAQMVMALLSC